MSQEHWDDELVTDRFRRLTENIAPAHTSLHELIRVVLDVPRGACRMTKLYWRNPQLPQADISAAYHELDGPGRTASEIAAIIQHRIDTTGSPHRLAPDERME